MEVFGVPLEELASAWGEELVKEATDWVSAEESAKVVEAQEMATARAVRELAVVAKDRRWGTRQVIRTLFEHIIAKA